MEIDKQAKELARKAIMKEEFIRLYGYCPSESYLEDNGYNVYEQDGRYILYLEYYLDKLKNGIL